VKDSLRLSRAEFWLLGAVVLGKPPVSWLTRDPDHLGELLNRGTHGLAREQLRHTLLDLFARGWIRMWQIDWQRPQVESAVPDPAPLLAEPDWPDDLFYGLTGRGGRAWEAFAQPAWSWHITHLSSINDPPVSAADRLDFDARFGPTAKPDEELEWHEIAAASAEKLQRYLWALAESHDFVEKKREPLTPWRATYWKTLPQGVMVTLLARERLGVTRCSLTHDWHRWWCRWD
jgi:hypothetical protein